MIYLVQYFFIFLLIIFTSIIRSKIKIKIDLLSFSKKTNHIDYILFASLILSIFSVHLSTSGLLIDANRYVWNFLYRYPSYNEEMIFSSGTEGGFLILNQIIYYFTNNSDWLFFLVAIFVNFFSIYVLTKMNSNIVLVLLLYLGSSYFIYSTFLLRQIIAVTIINLAFLAYLQSKKVMCGILSFIAILFHTTAIIILPFYFLVAKTKSMKNYIYSIIFIILIFLTVQGFFNNIIQSINYLDRFIETESSFDGSILAPLKGIPFYILSLFSLLNRDKLLKRNSFADFYILSSIIYSICWLLTFEMYWAFRLGLYFLIPTLALIPLSISIINNKKERLVMYAFLIIFISTLTFRQLVNLFIQ